MKIAQITHSYLPNIGGIENYIKRLTQFLKKRRDRPFIKE
jgi:hypothetical protein